jgi:hypothetical protein
VLVARGRIAVRPDEDVPLNAEVSPPSVIPGTAPPDAITITSAEARTRPS